MTSSPQSRPSLVGEWRKVDAPDCADRYPQYLTFAASTYRGRRGETQGFIWWDAGIYRFEGDVDLFLSVATDELMHYRAVVGGDRLHIEDADGCGFTYERVQPSAAVPG